MCLPIGISNVSFKENVRFQINQQQHTDMQTNGEKQQNLQESMHLKRTTKSKSKSSERRPDAGIEEQPDWHLTQDCLQIWQQ